MKIREGSVEIEALSTYEKGPGKISSGFYNRTMQTSRDLTVSLLNAMKPGLALDSMAGTGIRGLRIAKETRWKVVLNDISKKNVRMQEENAKANSVDVEIMNDDYFCAVSSRKWDYIDVDPFGSPSGLVDAAIMNLKNNGIIGVTMTDTANLEGRSINKGRRIYGSASVQGVYSKEISTRIFTKFLIERGAALDRGGRPLMALRDGHFIRVFVSFRKGSGAAEAALNDLKTVDVAGKKVGPLYLGRLYDPELLKRMESFPFSDETKRIFSNFRNEDLMFLFFMNSKNGMEVKKMKIVEELQKRGHSAGGTNFHPKGIKSNIDEEGYRNILNSL